MGDFNKAFAFTIGVEGGLSKSSSDPGNWSGGEVGHGELCGTKYGITVQALNRWRGIVCNAEDIECLELSEAKEIYRHHYWDPIHGESLPEALALCTFDAAVNSGTDRAIKWLQGALGAITDGVVGPSTTRLAKNCDVGEVVNDLLAVRLDFMQHLKIWPINQHGWQNRLHDLRLACFG